MIQPNKSLQAYNTFGVASTAEFFVEIFDRVELAAFFKAHTTEQITVLGGGSNILLTQNLSGIVLKISLTGIEVVEESPQEVILEVQAGESWHDVVSYCLDQDYGGIENLALIPGQMGTAPMQNIGAYGVELKDVFDSCVAMNRETQEFEYFDREACAFGYRESVFKQKLKNKYVICSVRLRLTKTNHRLTLDYGSIKDVLSQSGIDNPSIRDVAEAVISIRQFKLPDPKTLGNSGSFFKNPIITKKTADRLKVNYPQLPTYDTGDGQQKIPAAWLIETAGYKGFRKGDAGVHKHQALVLVNYGQATGAEIWRLAQSIQDKVEKEFGIRLMPEVNIY